EVPPALVKTLIRALVQELPAFLRGEDFNCRVQVSSARFIVAALRAPASDRAGKPLLAETPLLVLDATPVKTLVDHLTVNHGRLPDVEALVALPDQVHVIQSAARTNGHLVVRDERHQGALLAEVAAYRAAHSVAEPAQEAAITFKGQRTELVKLGFAEGQVLSFGSVRGTNALARVRRLHVVGPPMPPTADITFLAQVIHHDGPAISAQLELTPRPYGAQSWEVDAVDFTDERVAELLHALREDELIQVIHRARIATLGDASDDRD